MSLNILWLVPIVYVLHMAEDAPRFVTWTKRYMWLFTSRFNTRTFIMGNTLFMTYVISSISLALAYPSFWTLALGLSTASWIFANFLFHALITLVSGIYSPGMVTAGALTSVISVLTHPHQRASCIHCQGIWCGSLTETRETSPCFSRTRSRFCNTAS